MYCLKLTHGDGIVTYFWFCINLLLLLLFNQAILVGEPKWNKFGKDTGQSLAHYKLGF